MLGSSSCFLTVLLDSLQSLSPPEGKAHPNEKNNVEEGQHRSALPSRLLALSAGLFLLLLCSPIHDYSQLKVCLITAKFTALFSLSFFKLCFSLQLKWSEWWKDFPGVPINVQ